MYPARFLMVLLCCASISYAQPSQTKNSLLPYFCFDSFYSVVGERSADVGGIRAGVEWKKRWRFGTGYYKVTTDIIENKKLQDPESSGVQGDSVKAQLFMHYFPLTAEYIYYRKDPWQVTFPFHLGYGRSYFEYYDNSNSKRKLYRHGVLAGQVGITVQLKLLRWIGIGSGIGYRFMPVNNRRIDTRMSSPVFSLGIRIFPGEIYKSLKRGSSAPGDTENDNP